MMRAKGLEGGEGAAGKGGGHGVTPLMEEEDELRKSTLAHDRFNSSNSSNRSSPGPPCELEPPQVNTRSRPLCGTVCWDVCETDTHSTPSICAWDYCFSEPESQA